MKALSVLRLSLLPVALIATSASADKGKATRSYDSLPPAAAHASPKANGLPNADGDKPGKGRGEGHDKGRGQGHGNGNGHGHDGDQPDS